MEKIEMPIRRTCGVLALVAMAFTACADRAAPRSPVAPAATTAPDAVSDFAFLTGTWKIRNRVLDGWLEGSTTWYEFDATAVERSIWGGRGNVEEWDGVSPKRHIQGLAVRLYDPTARHWSIWWADRSLGTVLSPPVVGGFKNGRGEFFSDSTLNGKPIRTRILWIKLTADSLRWEQAYSADGGATWETNWIMSFTRTAP
jgi:hypothetical protein